VFTISTREELKVNNWLSEVPVHVVICAWVYRHSKHLLGLAKLNYVARLVVIGQEEGCLVSHPLSLLRRRLNRRRSSPSSSRRSSMMVTPADMAALGRSPLPT